LLSACNPNIIELIGVRESEIIQISDLGREVRDNSQLFLSKRCFKSFINYANAQLRRLENALARDSYNKHDKQKHIIKSIETQLLSNQMPEGIHPESFSFSLQDDIHVSVNLKDVPLNSFLATQSLISNTVRNFGKLNHRNHKKDEYHLNKHAMHLIRLYLMGIEILESGEINTYREKDRDLLLSIKNGEMPYQDVFKLQAELEERIKKAYDTSKLQEQVDLDKISDFVFRMHDKYLE
jgi:predicted nucleotidyltransferase